MSQVSLCLLVASPRAQTSLGSLGCSGGSGLGLLWRETQVSGFVSARSPPNPRRVSELSPACHQHGGGSRPGQPSGVPVCPPDTSLLSWPPPLTLLSLTLVLLAEPLVSFPRSPSSCPPRQPRQKLWLSPAGAGDLADTAGLAAQSRWHCLPSCPPPVPAPREGPLHTARTADAGCGPGYPVDAGGRQALRSPVWAPRPHADRVVARGCW